MLKSDIMAKIAGFGIFYRWHPAIALRYLPFVDEIKQMEKTGKILEVGSGGLGIAPYLGRKVTGVDINFAPPYHPLLKKVKAQATKLPFADSSFDVVLSMDMLEHLKKRNREKAIYEITRVARREILIGVPSGKQAFREDVKLHNYYVDKFGKSYPFFEEQIKEGLPDAEEIYKIINKSANLLKKKVHIEVVGNENITLHEILMLGWMTNNLLIDIFFRKILLFAIPLLRILDRPPYYRQLFFVDIKYEDSN